MVYNSILNVFVLVLGILVNCCILSINSDITTEKIIGGAEAFPANFKYHVGIIGKHNHSTARFLACSAGIITDFLLLGNAECVLDLYNELFKLRFYAIVGSINLRNDFQSELEITNIYTSDSYPTSEKGHYLAIFELMYSLNVDENNTHLRVLRLPEKNVLCTTSPCVAGYGVSTLSEKISSTSKPRITSKKDYKLMYAHVTVVDDIRCYNWYRFMKLPTEFCGIIDALPEVKLRGICKYDEGAPLVLGDDLLIGVARKHRDDCDNTVYGHLYSRVSDHLDFINGIKNGTPAVKTKVHINRAFITTD